MKFHRCSSNTRRWFFCYYGIMELKLLRHRDWPTALPRTYTITLRWKKFRFLYKLYQSEKKFTGKDIAFCFVKGMLFLFIQWAVCYPISGLLLLIAAISSVLSSCFERISDSIGNALHRETF